MDEGRCQQLSETELAARALAGSSPAWDEIVRRHSHRVLLMLLARKVPWDAAHDLVQEVWLRLVRQQREGRLKSLTLPGLAIAQAEWLAREEDRTRRRRERIAEARVAGLSDDPVDTGQEADLEERAERRERMDLVRRQLASCPPRARQIFQAVYGAGGRSHAEVARQLGISVQRVRQAVCEVRSRIRAALKEKESGGET